MNHGKSNQNLFYVVRFFAPTFVTKVTEYLCSGWIFSSDQFRLFNETFLTKFLMIIKRYFCIELKLENVFHLYFIFCKVMGV